MCYRLRWKMNVRIDRCITRLQTQDEVLESLDEGLNKLSFGINELSEGANETGQDLFQRVRCLEQIQDAHQQQVSALEKVKDALYETINAQALAIDVMQKQVKEINSRLTALTNKYLELRPQKKQPKSERVSVDELKDVHDLPTLVNMVNSLKKSGRLRKVK